MYSLLQICCVAIWIQKTFQHGYLADPPQRSSIWRENPNAPVNYNDNQLFCGGRENLRLYQGKCGACGDPYQGPHDNEAGGKYAKGIIVRSFPANQQNLPVKVVLTAYHKGYYEFKICPHNNIHVPVSQRCLDKYPLTILEGSKEHRTRYYPKGNGTHHMTLMLPRGIRCSQCVLQWRYRTGNSWGVDRDTNMGCIGCGDQEEFWNCADIRIGSSVKHRGHWGGNSEESGSDSEVSVKDAGIKILNHFFSPFLTTNPDNTAHKDRVIHGQDHRDLFNKGVTWQNLFMDSASHYIDALGKTKNKTILNSELSAVDSNKNPNNNIQGSMSPFLQDSQTIAPNGIFGHTDQHESNRPTNPTITSIVSEQSTWLSLIGGNHGSVRTSLFPEADWIFLNMFDK